MCGIVGAVAERNVVPILLEGLKRLEYRGYDSAGVAVLDANDVEAFRVAVGGDGLGVLVADAGDQLLDGFNRDWFGGHRGQSQCVIRPKTSEELAAVLAHCHARRIAVVPQGGNTGLVGGSVPVFDEVVISTSRMNAIGDFDPPGAAELPVPACTKEVHRRDVLAFVRFPG